MNNKFKAGELKLKVIQNAGKLKIKKRIQLIASIKYDSTIARRFHDIRYYSSRSEDIKNKSFREREKERLKSKNRQLVSDLIQQYKIFATENRNKIFRILNNIYKKNVEHALAKKRTTCSFRSHWIGSQFTNANDFI